MPVGVSGGYETMVRALGCSRRGSKIQFGWISGSSDAKGEMMRKARWNDREQNTEDRRGRRGIYQSVLRLTGELVEAQEVMRG
jgi:hypothetical protein